MLKPFKVNYEKYFKSYDPIEPTGRYKFKTITYEKYTTQVMYIEVKGGFMNWFTEWLHEDYITFRDVPTISEEIFECSKGDS